MRVTEAAILGGSLKLCSFLNYLHRGKSGAICGCYLGGAVLAVTEPSEWDALFADNDTFFRVLGEKFPWLEGSPQHVRNQYEAVISGWYIEMNLGLMTPEQLHWKVRTLEPDCGECNNFSCTCTKEAEEVQAEHVTA